jgi:predicted ATPase
LAWLKSDNGGRSLKEYGNEIKIKNLGVLKQAEFTLGDMTIICGGNNTGKTYATYALFGFLSASFCLYRSYQHF